MNELLCCIPLIHLMEEGDRVTDKSQERVKNISVFKVFCLTFDGKSQGRVVLESSMK